MKKILLGQLLAWSNIATALIGYFLTRDLVADSGFMQGLLACLGVVGTGANSFFSILLQANGYKELKLTDILPS